MSEVDPYTIEHTYDRGRVKFPPYAGPHTTSAEALPVRFKHVISIAGYSDYAVEKIFAEWFPLYMNGTPEHPVNMPKFIQMLDEYERDYKRDGEII